MAYLISDLQNDLEAKLHDTSLDKLTGSIYSKIYEAARNVLLRIDPQETMRVANLSDAIYDQVYSYVCPTDLKGDRIVAIRPQINNNPSNNFTQTYTEYFDRYKTVDTNSLSVDFNSGVKTIKLATSLRAGANLNECDSTTGNGTWAVGGNASNLLVDNLNYVSGSGSLKFDLAAGGSAGYLENSTMTAVDLSSWLLTGTLFVWVYIPSTSITSIGLRFGSDSSNYYSSSATTASDNTAFRVGWNLCSFLWSGVTTTGTPVSTAIDYIRVTYNYSSASAILNCRLDSIVARLGSIFEIVYYSKYLFKNSSGTWIEKPTADTDIVNLDTESYDLLLYELAYLVAQELQAENSNFDINFWTTKKGEVWAAYMRAYKSQVILRQVPYYRVRKRYNK